MAKFAKFIAGVASHFAQAGGWAMSSHIALSILLSLFPFLIFATSLAGFLGFATRTDDMVALMFETWPDDVATPIAREAKLVLSKPSTGFLTIGIALTLFFASNGVEAVRVALNRAYRVQEDRSIFYCRAQSLLFILLGSIVLLLNSFLLVFVPFLQDWLKNSLPPTEQFALPIWLLRYSLAIAALAFALFACHAWLPAGKRRITQLWPGVTTPLLVWIAAAALFAEYLRRFADYSAIFAGLAGVMTALVFLYLMAVILILGGELNAALLHADRNRGPGS